MSTTISAVAGTTGSGLGSERHIAWAPNSQLWWAFAYTGTNVVSSWYSSDGSSWTAGATHTLAQAHNSEGRNLAVTIKSISSVDCVHIGLIYKSGTSLGANALRATVSGTTLTYHSSDSTVASATGDGDALYWAGSGLDLDSNNKVHFANGWSAGGNGDSNSSDSTADAGTAEQMTPVTWTSHVIDAGITAEVRSGCIVDLGSSKVGFIADDGQNASTATGLNWYTWSGSSWNVDPGNQKVTGGSVTAFDKNDWGAVALSPTNIHVVYRDGGTGDLIHRRYDGTSWGAGQSLPAQSNVAGGGVALTADGASVWCVIIDTDGANTVRSCQWSDLAHNQVGDQWGSWQVVEGSSATRTFVGVARDVAASVGLAYWSEGSNLVAAAFAASSPPDPGFYTWIQSNQGSSSTAATTFAVAFSTQNIVSGNRIIVAISEWNSTATTITSVTDSAGNAYLKDKDAVLSDGTHVSIWSAPITVGGGTKPTVTAHASASTSEWAMWVHEYSGVTAAAANYLDGTNSFTTSVASSPITSGASTPAPGAANELAFGFYGDGGNNIATIGVSAGWTQRGSSIQGSSTTAEGACSDQATSAGTGSNASFTLSGTGAPGGVLVAVYKLAAVPGGGGPPALGRTLGLRPVWRGLRRPIPFMPAALSSLSPACDPTSSAATSSWTATLTVTVALSGTSAARSSLTAAPSEAVAISGPVAATAVLSGAQSASAALTGVLVATSTEMAAPALQGALSGPIQAVSAESGALSAAVALSAPVAAMSAATAVTSSAVALSGPLAGVSVLTGAPQEAINVSGALTAILVLSGTATTATPVAGTIAAVSRWTGVSSLSVGLAGNASSVAGLTAGVSTTVGMTGTLAGVGGASGALSASVAVAVAGSVASVLVMTGTLSTAIPGTGPGTVSAYHTVAFRVGAVASVAFTVGAYASPTFRVGAYDSVV